MRALPAVLVLLGCGAQGARSEAVPCSEQPFTFTGPLGQPVDAILASNVFLVPLTVGSTRKAVAVDTGSPFTVLDPVAFPQEPLPRGKGSLTVSAQLGALQFPSLDVVGDDLGVKADAPAGGIVGGETLCHFETSFDYRQPRLFLGRGALPTDLEAKVTLAAPLRGGGRGAVVAGGDEVTFPATRVLLEAQLDGVSRTLMLDTGASITLLDAAAFAALTGDGRKVVDDLLATTGVPNVRMTRVKQLRVGTATVASALVGSIPDTQFQQLSAEVGQQVDGLLGGTFLREFLLTVGSGEVTLRRYPTRAHIHDEYIRLGFALRAVTPTPASGLPRYEVGAVFPGSDAAAKGLTVGTKVVAINGNSLAMLSPAQAEAQLVGEPGPALVQTDTRSFTVAVEDLLTP